MPGKIHTQHRLAEDRLEPALHLGVEAFVVAGNIAVAVCGGGFDETHFPDVPGNSRLRHLEALLTQVLEQHLLTADGVLLDQSEDRLLTFCLAF